SKPPSITPDGTRRRVGAVPLIGSLLAGLVVAVLVGAMMGAYGIPPLEVVAVVARKLGLSSSIPADPMADDVFWNIRLARVALAVLVGASLGCAGATMQGSFANPLAEPGIVGVSSGAVLGAVAQIVLGFAPLGTWTLPAAAFVGGLVTVVAV